MNTARRYYAASNAYGSETSTGFSNTWQVHVFSNPQDRNEWVDGRNDMASRVIKRSEIPYYLSDEDNTPTPYSGEHRAVVPSIETDQVAGHIGRIETVPSGLGFDRLN